MGRSKPFCELTLADFAEQPIWESAAGEETEPTGIRLL